MDRQQLSQAELARLARVSQSTVSRALSGRSLRRGAARRRLFSYTGIDAWTDTAITTPSRDRVVAGFQRIEQNSKLHADAIAVIIDALAGLEPASKRRRRG